MDIDKVMDDVANRLRTIDGLSGRVQALPADGVTPTAVMVRYPDSIRFDASYGRGMDVIEIGIVLLAGRVVDRVTRDTLATYCSGDGSSSIKWVLESGEAEGAYTAFDNIKVTGIDFTAYAQNGIDYLAAIFAVEIAGRGTTS